MYFVFVVCQNIMCLNMKKHYARLRLHLSINALGQNFLLVDLRDFFSDLGSRGRKKTTKKALKMTS